MTPLDTKHTVHFAAPAKKDIVLTTPQIPGLEVRIPKGSVIRDENGKTVTELGITAISIDRPPFPLPKNSVVPVYFTVQPGGTYVFPEGAQIVYPNYTHEPPATRVDFMDYDPTGKGSVRSVPTESRSSPTRRPGYGPLPARCSTSRACRHGPPPGSTTRSTGSPVTPSICRRACSPTPAPISPSTTS
ncbi:hypothetical protein ACQ86D_00220 [Streptomyces galilaeus]